MYIQDFQSITKKDIGTAGGKGANLGEMTRAGIPVPCGAVVTVQAYERFLEFNEIKTSGNPEQIRASILEGQIPEEVRTELFKFYQDMGTDTRVAVRSSATAEDLEDASFAGQQETFLNVQGEELLEESIKACYASLWGDRAVSYRRSKGYDTRPVALAVVIQRMVESDTAGVLFTQNPASGSQEEMVINASYGLGESVVSGAVSPDEWICSRDGQILHQVIGSKETKVIYGETKTVTVPVKEEDRRKLSLTPDQVKKLVRKGMEIEAHYQVPMDIEWAFMGEALFILQARAVTAKGEKKVDEKQLPPIRPVNKKMRETLLFMMEKEPFTYDPLDYDFSMILGRQKAVIFAEGGIHVDNECGMDENGFMSLPTEKIGLGRGLSHLPGLLKGMKNHSENARKANLALESAKQKIGRLAEMDFSQAGMEECLFVLRDLHRMITDTAYARFRYAVFPGFLMNRTLEKYLKQVDKKLTAYDLLTGLSYKTADMNRDLAGLAEKISSEEALKDALLSGETYENVTSAFPKSRKWFEEFMESYGYKSDFNCYCFLARSWKEDKNRFLQVLRPLLTTEAGGEMFLSQGELLHKELLLNMTKGRKEKQARKILSQVKAYRFYHVFREETQYLWEMAFYACRKVLRRTEELFGAGEQELLYLFWEELQEAMGRGILNSKDLENIRRRKRMRPLAEEYWRRQQWEALKGEGDNLKGISGSAGEVAGEVCIITNPGEFGKLQKGKILVCRYTDPEWTPLFTLAAAVVSDTGGVLSHAAIVAREYNIPAVLATGCATTKLKDGDKVFVNGTTGEVYLTASL